VVVPVPEGEALLALPMAVDCVLSEAGLPALMHNSEYIYIFLDFYTAQKIKVIS
jgi:hypothetical protein